jgi:hypothetical protein
MRTSNAESQPASAPTIPGAATFPRSELAFSGRIQASPSWHMLLLAAALLVEVELTVSYSSKKGVPLVKPEY